MKRNMYISETEFESFWKRRSPWVSLGRSRRGESWSVWSTNVRCASFMCAELIKILRPCGWARIVFKSTTPLSERGGGIYNQDESSGFVWRSPKPTSHLWTIPRPPAKIRSSSFRVLIVGTKRRNNHQSAERQPWQFCFGTQLVKLWFGAATIRQDRKQSNLSRQLQQH